MNIKLGYPSLAEDLAVIRAVQSALNADEGARALIVDYNQSLSFAEALARCHALDRLAEEGIFPWAGLKSRCGKTTLPVTPS